MSDEKKQECTQPAKFRVGDVIEWRGQVRTVDVIGLGGECPDALWSDRPDKSGRGYLRPEAVTLLRRPVRAGDALTWRERPRSDRPWIVAAVLSDRWLREGDPVSFVYSDAASIDRAGVTHADGTRIEAPSAAHLYTARPQVHRVTSFGAEPAPSVCTDACHQWEAKYRHCFDQSKEAHHRANLLSDACGALKTELNEAHAAIGRLTSQIEKLEKRRG